MKKLVAIGVAVLLAVPLGGSAALAGKKQQKIEGSVAAAARHPDGCYSGVHRRLQAVTMQNANGLFGYDWDVDKATWNKPFVLELTGGAGSVDLDITYYLAERTTLDDFVEQGGDPAAPPTYAYETHEPGGEKGKVPQGAVYAIVCIYQSENGVGALADFTYTAG